MRDQLPIMLDRDTYYKLVVALMSAEKAVAEKDCQAALREIHAAKKTLKAAKDRKNRK